MTREEMLKDIMITYYEDDYGYINFKEDKGKIIMAFGTIENGWNVKRDIHENMILGVGDSYEELFKEYFEDPIHDDFKECLEDECLGYFETEQFEFLKEYFN